MKNTIKTLSLLALVAILAAGAFGQTVTLSTTTLSAALSSVVNGAAVTTVTLASTSGMLANGPNAQVNTALYVDRELMYVKSIPSSGTVIVQRGAGTGAGARITSHASGATVYWAATQTLGSVIYPASVFFSLVQPNAQASGTCTATNELVLPKIYSFSGDFYTCANGSSGGQWIRISNGTNGVTGDQIRAFCTGTVGSAATDYLNGSACSTSTSSGVKYVIQNYGTLYGLRLYSSAAFVGTGGSVLTVLKNGSSTGITCTPTATATTCASTANSVAVAPGDLITFSFLSATSDTAADLAVAIGIY